ncbi:MAG TPA: FAD-binding oxidoreductase [Verrucomicrobiales bacterium]|nr:FAD-binding oxidoreductase [Verrucomicrobiales bacterium]
MSDLTQDWAADIECEVRTDPVTLELYSTDASIYRIRPAAVAFPRSAAEASQAIRAAAAAGIPVTPRGAGSGLVGGAIGDGLVIDFSRHNTRISPPDLERRRVRVGAGVVLDQLNDRLRPHGVCFGPDVATSSRATLGGMIANNSSGSHTPVYGTTADHVCGLEVVLADGRIVNLAIETDPALPEFQPLRQLLTPHAGEVEDRFPAGFLKRWPGYGIDRFLREPALANLLAGSEGTLAAIVSAELRLSTPPREKGLGLLFFDSVGEAMQATVELASLRPAAVEHIDRILMDQTRGQLQFRAARALMDLDARPAEALLLVEFFDEVGERLALLEKSRLGRRRLALRSASEMAMVWNLRKAGLSLLTGCPGAAKPTTCIEDTAVHPERLPAYVSALQGILRPLGVEACFYGHAASGLLHVRPVLDLHDPEGLSALRRISDEVSALVREFRGSIAAEHGVGIARTEYLDAHLGPRLAEATRGIKRILDPGSLLNPGKVVHDGRYRIDTHLRTPPGGLQHLPFAPVLAYAAKDGAFAPHLDQCNGCGGCRKGAPTMCPTFVATGEEALSTRGRANLIRAGLEGRFRDPGAGLSPEMLEAVGHCLACKACATECPSNVNMALLKAELLHAEHRRSGVPLAARAVAGVGRLGELASVAPALANAFITSRAGRWLLQRALGIDPRRPLPSFAGERFDDWFAARGLGRPGARGPVILWDDCFVRHNEPGIGRAAVQVLEAAGFEVHLLRERRCCGRPAFSQGLLDEARRSGEENVALLGEGRWAGMPVLFLEPSCHSMFAEDYRELGIPGAGPVATRAVLFEAFIARLLDQEPEALRFRPGVGRVAIHVHCHSKALAPTSYLPRLVQRIPGSSATLLNTGCCGMAGAFGATESHYDLSVAVARPLVEAIHSQPDGALVVASGTSCRHQIHHCADRAPLHMAELLARSLA